MGKKKVEADEAGTGLDHVVSTEGPSGPEVAGEGYYVLPMAADKATADGKLFKKLAKAVESLVRRSDEYREFCASVLSKPGMGHCAFLSGVDGSDVTVELHHHPFTLFEITEIVLGKQLSVGPTTTFDAADEVLRLHWEGKVGVVPLSKTVHEMAHQGDVFIGVNKVVGKVGDFVRELKPYMEKDHRAKLETLIRQTLEGKSYSETNALLAAGQRKRVLEPQFAEAELCTDTGGVMLVGPEPVDLFGDVEK